MDLQQKFIDVYKRNLFGGTHSRSGEGSDLFQTRNIRTWIPHIFKKYNIRSILDAPCGDFFWMKEVNIGNNVKYIGYDIVPEVINKNIEDYSNNNTSFECVNLVNSDIPKVDLILCRDCFIHLGYKDAFKIISNFKKSGSKYLMISTYNKRTFNSDLNNQFFRPINMQIFPFNFNEPLDIFVEGCTEANGVLDDKCLGLWLLNDITCGVPKRIFTIWLGGEIPELCKKCIKTQKELENKGYEHRMITLENCFKDNDYIQEALNSKSWVKAADYLRMYYLFHEGGIYLDSDVHVLKDKDFDNLLMCTFFASYEENLFVSNACMGFVPNHPMLREYLDKVVKEYKGNDNFVFESGMGYFTPLAYKYRDSMNIIYPPEYFIPYNHQTERTNITENTITYHHFMKSWINQQF